MKRTLIMLLGCMAVVSLRAADSSSVTIAYIATAARVVGSTDWTSAKLQEYGGAYKTVTGSQPSYAGIGITVGRLGTSTSSFVGTAEVRYTTSNVTAVSEILFLPVPASGGYLDYLPTEYRVGMSYRSLAMDAGIGYSLQGVVIGARVRLGYILDGSAVEALHVLDRPGYTFPIDTPPVEGRLSADRRSLITGEYGVDVFSRLQVALGGSVGYYYDIGQVRLGVDTHILLHTTSLHASRDTPTTDVGAAFSIGWSL